MEKAKSLHSILLQTKHEAFANIMTCIVSMFQFSYGAISVWLHEEEELIEVEKSLTSVKKLMLTVLWDIEGIYLINFLPEHQKINSEYFISNIIIPIGSMKDSILLHLDNC